MIKIRGQLIRDEGVRLKAYQDPVGKWTIGVGRNLEDRGITHAEALYLLDNDIADFTKQVNAALPWAAYLDEARFAVLVNMAFNMGIGDDNDGLLSFKKMLLNMRNARWNQAAAELLDSDYAKQVGDRARRLAAQLMTGTWM